MVGIVGHLIDMTCPFSKKAWNTLVDVSSKYNRDQVQFRKLDWVQLWHPQGYILALASSAVKMATGGSDDKWFRYTSWLYENQMEFLDDKVYRQSREQIEARLASVAQEVAGVSPESFAKALADDKTVRLVKDHTKYGRQNGVHESPTFIVNGLITGSINSGWTVNQWTGMIDNLLAAVNAQQ